MSTRDGNGMERKFTGIWIPAVLWQDEELSLQEKVLIADILSFETYWRSNAGIAKLLGVNVSRVQQIVRELKRKNVLEGFSKTIGTTTCRTLRVTKAYWEKLYAYDQCKRPEEEPENAGVENYTPCKKLHPGGVENYIRGCKKLHFGGVENYTQKANIESKEESTKKVVVVADQRQRPFKPPTVEEVKAYITEKGYTFDAEMFVSYYESRGWMLGKTKMKSWQAACRTWQLKERGKTPPPTSERSSPLADIISNLNDYWRKEAHSERDKRRNSSLLT